MFWYLPKISRDLDEDNGSDSASLKWSDSESEDDEDDDAEISTSIRNRSQSGGSSPAKKERKIEIEIEDILYVHSVHDTFCLCSASYSQNERYIDLFDCSESPKSTLFPITTMMVMVTSMGCR